MSQPSVQHLHVELSALSQKVFVKCFSSSLIWQAVGSLCWHEILGELESTTVATDTQTTDALGRSDLTYIVPRWQCNFFFAALAAVSMT